jgi:hypothetical protein
MLTLLPGTAARQVNLELEGRRFSDACAVGSSSGATTNLIALPLSRLRDQGPYRAASADNPTTTVKPRIAMSLPSEREGCVAMPHPVL